MRDKIEKYRLKDICHIEKGRQIDTDMLDDINEYKYINGGVGASGFYGEYNTSGETVTVSEGGVSCGYVNYICEPFWCGCHCYRLTEIYVYPKYLFFALKANQNRIMGLRTGSAMPNIKKSTFEEFEVRLSNNKLEQREVVKILSSVNKLIEQMGRQLVGLDELIKARFVEMFGDPIENTKEWPVKKLNELSVLITNGNTPKGGSNNYVDEGVIFLRSQNVWRNFIDMSDVAYIDEKTHANMKKSSVRYNDILITKTGRINTENSSLGRAALYCGSDNRANINGHVYLVRLNKEVVPRFVLTILTGEAYRKYIRRVCVGGIDKRQINLDQVEDFPIITPPKDKQEEFVRIVEQVDKSKAKIQKSLDETQLLFDSLMQKYFG